MKNMLAISPNTEEDYAGKGRIDTDVFTPLQTDSSPKKAVIRKRAWSLILNYQINIRKESAGLSKLYNI